MANLPEAGGLPTQPASINIDSYTESGKETAMATRTATCSCGQLRAVCEGEPLRVSICHCLECQRRTGSVFAVQARFARSAVTFSGRAANWSRTGDSGGSCTFSFCPVCASIVYWEPAEMPDIVLVAIGAFADPHFPPPHVSVYEERQHAWSRAIGDLPLERYA
jgi:hypothetical protein